MHSITQRIIPFPAFILLGLGLVPARGEDDVEERLFRAKRDYAAEVEKLKKSVVDLFDKREEAARKDGNKKLVEQIKAERKTFENWGDVPPTVDKEPLTAARVKLDAVYAAAIKDCIRLKQDAAAEVVEREREEFLVTSALMLGRKKYLVTLKHFNLKVHCDTCFTNNGTRGGEPFKLKGEPVPHSIFLHPPPRGASQVSYNLAGKSKAFRAIVGVLAKPVSPPWFEVLGDDKSLWKSSPVDKADTFQTCTVKVEKVKVLTLLVHCTGEDNFAWAVWFEPVLIE
ncbi:MAG: hypothetical protein JWO38_1423 [Gemmataceae bacterium]|nr:hypothetical protein [Gemmataceae bacterium]